MPDADVHHVERLRPQVLGQLQELVEAKPVGGRIAPVGVHVPRPPFYRAHRPFPMVGVLRLDVALHVAAAREAHEGRMQGLQLLSQVDAAAVLPALEGRREEAHHIQQHRAGALHRQTEVCLSVGLLGHQRRLYLLPALPKLLIDSALAQQLAVLVGKGSLDDARLSLQRLYPEREPVLRPCHRIDAPVAGVADAAEGLRRLHLQRVTLFLV